MVKRETITNELRFSIFKRDNFTCQYCGKKAPDIEIQIDHIIPVSSGGDNRPNNLITACYKCNLGKTCDRLYEKEDKEALMAAEKNRLERMTKYSYYTNYICKVFKNADIKYKKKIIDRFTSINFSNDEEFNDFKREFYEKEPSDILNIIEDCVGKCLKYSTYNICYTEKRKCLLSECGTVYVTDSKFIWQLHDLMKNYWCDHTTKRTEYIYQIAEYFEAKYHEKNKGKLKQSNEDELIELSNTILCLSEFIKDDDKRMIRCLELVDEYFEKEGKTSFIDFVSNDLKEYMEENGWQVLETKEKKEEDLTENEKRVMQIPNKEVHTGIKKTIGRKHAGK